MAAVAGLTLGLATVGTDTGGAGVALGILAASAFALVPPAIHLAHGSSRDALLSFAVRTAPIGLGLLLFAATTRHTDCGEGCAQLPSIVQPSEEALAQKHVGQARARQLREISG